MSLKERCQESTRRVISASRRTDLPARFPEWLAAAVSAEKAEVLGPSGRTFIADLCPRSVHTFVLWSKDYSALLEDRSPLRALLGRYDQLYFHLTITGLGGSRIEPGAPPSEAVLGQVGRLVELAGHPRRVSLRFDPVVFWREAGRLKTNISFFETLAARAASRGIVDIRFSFAQWYGKARRRAVRRGFDFVDPPLEEKLEAARGLAKTAAGFGLNLWSCSQNFLTGVPGVRASSCIDGPLLQELHPGRLPVSRVKDGSQRPECGCTESVDIGSYTQFCPHACVYCYARPIASDS